MERQRGGKIRGDHSWDPDRTVTDLTCDARLPLNLSAPQYVFLLIHVDREVLVLALFDGIGPGGDGPHLVKLMEKNIYFISCLFLFHWVSLSSHTCYARHCPIICNLRGRCLHIHLLTLTVALFLNVIFSVSHYLTIKYQRRVWRRFSVHKTSKTTSSHDTHIWFQTA